MCPSPKNKKDYPCDLCATDPFVTPILAINTNVSAVTNKKNENGNNGSALLTLLLPWRGHGGAESLHLKEHTGNSTQEIRTQNLAVAN